MNKHAVSEVTLIDFIRSFGVLQDCLAKCGEVVVKVRFHIGFRTYGAKVWSEKMEGAHSLLTSRGPERRAN